MARTAFLIFLPAILLLNQSGRLRAEAPHVSYIFPAGGQRGQTVDFHVGGHFMHEGCAFEMSGTGISATPRVERTDTVWFEGPVIPMPASQRKEDYPRDYRGWVKISADCPPGLKYWRVWTSQGITPRMKFVVGRLPEIVEQEIDGAPIPVGVELPVTINGRIFPREDVDIWTFDATQGETLTCEVMAARLGSPLDSRIEIRGPDGATVAENVDAFGTDSFVGFTAPETGTYECRIHDIEFGGLQHYVYRLTIRRGPYVQSVYPAGGQRNAERPFSLIGLALPETAASTRVLPSPDGFMLWYPIPQANPVRLIVSDAPERLEQEPNEVPDWENPPDTRVPVVFNGRIQTPDDVDIWPVLLRKEQKLLLEVAAEQLGSPLDPLLSIVDADGKQLASSADGANGTADPRMVWTAPDEGVFGIRIQDELKATGSPESVYRLAVSELPFDSFELLLPTDSLTVDRGGEAKLKVAVDRTPGWKEAIELSVEGLPEGVTVEGTTVGRNRRDAQLVLKAGEAAPLGLARLRITGRPVDGMPAESITARFPTSPGTPLIDDLTLCVAMPTPFRFQAPFETKYAARGTTFTRSYSIIRDGYEGPIEVEIADRQVRHLQGVTGNRIIVPPGESTFDFTIALAPWMQVGRTSRTCLMASALVEDEHGQRHRVSYSSTEQNDQIIVLVDPSRLSISLEQASVLFSAGRTVTLPVRIARGAGLHGAVQVSLTAPRHITDWSAGTITIPADRNDGVLDLTFTSDSVDQFNMPLTVRASMPDESGRPVIATADVHIRDQ